MLSGTASVLLSFKLAHNTPTPEKLHDLLCTSAFIDRFIQDAERIFLGIDQLASGE